MTFYRLLHIHDGFQWHEQADEAFQKFKQYLKQLLTLMPPKDGEVMLLYVAVTPKVFSAALVFERQEAKSTKQHQFIS